MKILITGPQGCGKTTQARLLAKKLGICFIGAGDLLREFAEKKGKINQEIEESLNQGQLVDNKVISELIKEKISKPECQNGFVVDGYPRTFSQHNLFDPGFDKVFYLKISDEEAKKRLLARGREDDTPEAISERLSWYHEETKPLLKYYQEKGSLIIIDGEKSIEQVATDIGQNLESETKR